ncbi:tripartite motif-containing protein 16-like isoform X2 [Erpetoichthys calabaricus]|uniref:tripartite motif-containing protein 16-like isoform X2 n=1 Tax=Erpetoichthys calabaricus TaxID=27687 RepID=UPI002234B4D1|nr:tripartite motif-containing protein 16-like isoform X2 [Erpetoichthys calabaricus]
MAAPQLSVSADRYSCSVCREVLKEPVTIPCGHSYCMRCINNYWDQSKREGTYNCPQCRRTFNVRPEINRNTVLTEIMETLKEERVDASPSQSYAGPDDVPCDVCPVRRRSAVKTCMTCMISYCETHLQPHKEHGAYKRHKLEEPTGNIEEKLCAKHQKLLEIFCRTDGTCVCLLCVVTDHKSHDTVTPEEERAEKQSLLKKREDEMKRKVKVKEKTLKKMKKARMRIQSSAEIEVEEHEETFKSVLESIERLKSDVVEMIREYERMELRKTDKIIEEVGMEIKEMKKRTIELAELLQTGDHIHFLKKFPSFCDPPAKGDVPSLTLHEDFLPETLQTNLSDLKKSLEEITDWKVVRSSGAGAGDSGPVLQNLRCRSHLLKYFRALTLDPITAHRRLCLSEGNRKVTCQETEGSCSDHPNRFDYWEQILCREALSGTCYYWEVECNGDEIDIGVAYKGIGRKGNDEDGHLGFNDKSWSLYYSDSGYTFWHDGMETDITAPYSQKIGVYLDCPTGCLSFFGISDTVTLLYKLKTIFTEPLYPAFGLGWHSSVTICPLKQLNK